MLLGRAWQASFASKRAPCSRTRNGPLCTREAKKTGKGTMATTEPAGVLAGPSLSPPGPSPWGHLEDSLHAGTSQSETPLRETSFLAKVTEEPSPDLTPAGRT